MTRDQFEDAGGQLSDVASEIAKVIVGQDLLVNRILTALLCEGHILIEGVPGLAKTKTVKTVAKVLGGSWQRIQFTPDLVPADLVGTRVFSPATGIFEIEVGPLNANFVLADEVNRAPAKVQSALLESMEERQITIARESFPLPRPFIVLATQNPIEQEGTYPLPEAQMDRFMMRVSITHPSVSEELEIVRRALSGDAQVNQKLDIDALSVYQALAREVYVPKEVATYAVKLIELSRRKDILGGNIIEIGASPRASIALVRAAQAQALINGRRTARIADIRNIATEIIAHRLVLSFNSLSDQIDRSQVVASLISEADTELGILQQ
jgi:MoxR-like ATPase